jgi:hypothetical protein
VSPRASFARIGAVAAFAGVALLVGSTLLHPGGADPNDAPAAFAEYAADPLWRITHLGQFVGFAALGVALIAFAATLESLWARIGAAGATTMIALAAALQAVDGIALKAMVDRWATASGDGRALAFEAAFAVRQVEVGLASFLSIVSGLTLIVFGLALVGGARRSWLLAAMALVGGSGSLAGGVAMAFTGFSPGAMTVSLLASFVLMVWALLVGFHMLGSAQAE